MKKRLRIATATCLLLCCPFFEVEPVPEEPINVVQGVPECNFMFSGVSQINASEYPANVTGTLKVTNKDTKNIVETEYSKFKIFQGNS